MVQTDEEIMDVNGVPVIPVPDDIMQELGWKTEDQIAVNCDPLLGTLTVSRIESEVDESLDELDLDETDEELV